MTGNPTNVRWRIFVILSLASFIAYVLRGNLSIAAPEMIKDLQLSEIQWGWVMAAFTTGYTIFQLPGGVLGDRMGPRKAITLLCIFWTILTIVTAVVPGTDAASATLIIGSLIAVRFLVGMFQAPIFPIINTAICRWFPPGGWGLPCGLNNASLTLGIAVSAPVLAWLIADYGWRVSFWIIAPIGLIVAALWWWYSRDFPAEHAAANEAEVALINANRPEIVSTPTLPPGWVRVLKDRNILLLTLSYAFSNFVFYSAFSWWFYYLVEVRAFNSSTAGYATSSQWIAGALGAVLGGWLCDRLCRKVGLRWGSRWPIIIGQVLVAAAVVIGAYHGNAVVAVACLALAFFAQQLTESAYWNSSIAIGNQLAGAAGGVLNTGGNAMGIVNALLVAWFAQVFGWPFAIASGAIFALIAAALLLFVRSDQPVRLD
ncbi:MAG: MFS transporter [Proteobacteria bacterium]|nr:MFS transporter [Pseudomonadota bacterium]